ncbi:MAG TPA: IclR family transcriptional regulator [Candidatus Limnocylindrales bacterium]|nr:IclR family transcriptional regulator [Candidatus Limnocylindrales bacterium]
MSRVQSIARAFDVLAALAEGPGGVTDVADRVGLPKSTVARMLSALALEGAVEQIPGDTRYRLGPRLGSLAAGVRPTRRLVAIAHPYLVELANRAGEATGLSVPEGPTMHYVDQVESPNPVQVRDWTGTRIPMHAVSSGQVFLAHFPPPALSRFLAAPLERFTGNTIIDASGLLARLRDVRREGYSWVREEYATGINSVAAPVADANGEVVAAVHIHGPSYRFPAAGADRTVAAEVVEAAAAIGARLRA